MKIFDDKYIVVTGGAGFIGSCLVKHLNDRGICNLILVDELGESEKWKNLVGKRFLDLLHKDHLFEWLQGRESDIEAFVHLGACSSTVEKDAHYLLENNYRYSLYLAEYALTHGHRFIYASSAATYGDGAHGFSDDHASLEELAPLNMYGYSKHLFDLWLKDQNVLDKVVGLKYFNIFGPNEDHKGRMASVTPKFVSDVLEKGEISLFKSSEPDKYADGQQVRDFVYVKDAVKMTASFLENDLTGLYNVGMGKPQTWKTVAEGVFAGVEKPAKIRFIDMPKDLLGKYQNYTCANMDKAKKAGVPIPSTPLHEAVVEYVRDYILPGKRW